MIAAAVVALYLAFCAFTALWAFTAKGLWRTSAFACLWMLVGIGVLAILTGLPRPA